VSLIESAPKVYFWKTKSTVLDKTTVLFDSGPREHEAATFTQYGIVYSHAKRHNDRIFTSKKNDELNYFVHYIMIHKGRMWHGKSWAGTLSRAGINGKANRFAEDAARIANEEGREYPTAPRIPTATELDLAQTQDALNRLVELVLTWINSTFPRIGMVWSCWEDYPVALRDAMTLLKGQGVTKERE